MISRRTWFRTTAVGMATLAVHRLPATSWAQSDRPIIIGHQCDLSGALASTGYWRDKAARAAVEHLNKTGGIGGRQVRYIVEDTESNPAVGIRKLRKLIQEDQADFIVGSEHGGVGIASAPIAKETKTPYFAMNRTDAVTGKAGNRYIFRLQNNTAQGARAVVQWALGELGKTWTVVYADYAWGHAHRDNWSTEVERNGGKIVAKIGVPVGTQDHMPYLTRVGQKSDAVFFALLGPDIPRSLTAMGQLGFHGGRLLADTIMEVFDPIEMGEVTQGIWGAGTLPLELSFRNTPHLRALRKAVGVDDGGREVGSGRLAVVGDVWAAWSTVYAIKLAAEKSGWRERKDTPKFVEVLEGTTKLPEGADFPQGDLLLRAEDHQGFMDFYLHRVEGKRIVTHKRLPKESTIYAPAVDYRKETL
jgi:branched-chain amino acid transport system substrate-binding protein